MDEAVGNETSGDLNKLLLRLINVIIKYYDKSYRFSL